MSSLSREQKEAIVSASNGEFSTGEVENFLNMADNIANAAVLNYLIKVLSTDIAKSDQGTAKSIIRDVEKLKYKKKTGYMSCNLFPQLSLNLGMTLAKHDYSFSLNAPDDNRFLEDLAHNIDVLLKITDAFWKQFCENNTKLIDRIKLLKPAINFDVLAFDRIAMAKIFTMKNVETETDEIKTNDKSIKTDDKSIKTADDKPKPKSKSLIPAPCNFKIVVFPCWVDGQGRPFIKK